MGRTVELHPFLPAPGWEAVAEEARRRGCSQAAAFHALLENRRQVIEAETADPLRCGYEPPIWHVCDALLGFEFCNEDFSRHIRGRFDMGWEEWAAAMRRRLGFAHPVQQLLIMGCNRSSKSEYAAKRGQLVLTTKAGARVYPFHMSNPRSVREQQPLFWKYMPPEWRVQTASTEEYIKYKKKTGFSENSFINPIGGECMFLNYMQDRDTALEGLEADLMLPDELVPPDWVETMAYRLATRHGRMVVTFTPINGYTPTVKIFQDSAEAVRESVGFMLPRDGGDPLPHCALGLDEREYAEVQTAEEDKRAAQAPHSRPEDCSAWLEEEDDGAGARPAHRPFGYGNAQPPAPEGRRFEMMPRVLRCVDPRKAVVFFHACDNPYGNTKEVIAEALQKGREEIRVRVYGKAERTTSCRFPKFSVRVHRLSAAAVPEEGTNWMLLDPASDRNFFLTWIRGTPEGSYVYREWPGTDEIPGVGIPDPWAVPSGKKEGRNDGERGRGQDSLGWGLLRYKFEIARLERWEDYKQWLLRQPGDEEAKLRAILDQALYPSDEELAAWDEFHGAEEVMEGRVVDSRAASTPRVEHDRPVTLFEDLLDLGMDFDLSPGISVDDGVAKVNTALDYAQDEHLSFSNRPHLYVSERCPNTTYALENWLGVDGQSGASKDPIDNLRYYYGKECGFVEPGSYGPRGGFYYGRGSQRARRTPGYGRPAPARRSRMKRARLNLGR